MEFLNKFVDQKTLVFVAVTIAIVLVMWYVQPMVQENLVIQTPGNEIDIKANVTFKYKKDTPAMEFISQLSQTGQQCQNKIQEKTMEMAQANSKLISWGEKADITKMTVGQLIDGANENGLGDLLNSMKKLGLNIKLENVTTEPTTIADIAKKAATNIGMTQ